MYRVVVSFSDLKDGKHEYKVGDVYPRKGVTVPDARIAELSSDKNRRGIPMITFEGEPTEEKKPRKSSKK